MGKENIKKKTIRVSAFVFSLYCIYYTSRYSSAMHNFVIVALFLLWNIVAIIEDSRAFHYALNTKSVAWLILFLGYYFITSIIEGDIVYTLEYVIIYACLYGTAFQYKYYLYRNNTRELRMLVNVLLLAFVAFSLSAIIFYMRFPSAARTLAADYYAFGNIAIGGGYSIAFGASILAVFLFELLLRKRSYDRRLFLRFLVLFVLFEFLLIKTESTTTLIASLVGIISAPLVLAYRSNNVKGGKIIVTALLMIALLIFVINMNEIGRSIVQLTMDSTDNVMLRRFNRIGLKLQYQGVMTGYTNYVDERFSTITSSWNTFLKHPILGVGYKCGNIYSMLPQYGVGTHSELFDTLAQHGIIGSAFWLMFIYRSIRESLRYSNSKAWIYPFIIMLIFNPFRSFHGFVVIFFIIPVMEYILYNCSSVEDSS
jgi:hypothetical protein